MRHEKQKALNISPHACIKAKQVGCEPFFNVKSFKIIKFPSCGRGLRHEPSSPQFLFVYAQFILHKNVRFIFSRLLGLNFR